jgi:hypothetical protein
LPALQLAISTQHSALSPAAGLPQMPALPKNPIENHCWSPVSFNFQYLAISAIPAIVIRAEC